MMNLFITGISLFLIVIIQGMLFCSCRNSSFGCIEEERQALLKLKQSFEDPSNLLVSWRGEDCCDWRGLSCNKSTGHVIKLDLSCVSAYSDYDSWLYDPSKNLHASEISSCLVELKHLEYLDLSGNDFNRSQLPEFLGSLKQLRYLNLSNTNLRGNIPRQLGSLSLLQILDLSRNGYYYYYNNNLVSENFRWASSLLSLQHLDASFMDLLEALDLFHVLSKLPSLSNLQLNYCGIENSHFRYVGTVNSIFLASTRVLSLRGNLLTGEIPHSLRNLTALRELDLSSQYMLYAHNLQWISSLSSLQRLDMSSVDLSKAIDLVQVLNTLPSLIHLGLENCGIRNIHFSRGSFSSKFLARVQFLNLGSNRLSGPILNFVHNMTVVRELDLSDNNFNSTIPLELVRSTSLVRLDLSSNNFEGLEGGVLSLINNICSLESLDLSYNPFRHEVFESEKSPPKCLAYNLMSLSLKDNGIGGTIPYWFGKFKALKYLFLSGNSFSGPISQSLGEISTLEELNLSDNQLEGIIPRGLWRLPLLRKVDFSDNRLVGTIPQFPQRFSSLERLDLSHNHLSGSIPESIGKLGNLYTLDISYNSLEGNVSELHFANMSWLGELIISSNRLTCKMKSDWIPPFNSLSVLKMSSCVIGSRFPRWIQVQNGLSELELSNANISGPFPIEFYSYKLIHLDLSKNQISGRLPVNIEDGMGSIAALLLGNNQLNGSISDTFCNLEGLQVLDLSENELSGEIPDCWKSSAMLSVINLSFNRLSGTIPNSIGNLSHLRWLHLNGNNLEGELPLALTYCLSLQLLDVGENNISGVVPAWIGENLLLLRILRLRENSLTGNIPSQLCRLSEMQILDLALNSLSGRIPRCFGNLKKMRSVVADVSRDSFVPLSLAVAPISEPLSNFTNIGEPVGSDVGSPPPDVKDSIQWPKEKVSVFIKGKPLDYTTTLLLVDGMDLSRNKLNGSIPDELCTLSGLRVLNLSHNHLVGKIPNKIGNLKVIETLDLSDNKLFGSIPQTMSTITTLNHLNLSYNNLSGEIPTGSQLQTLGDPSIYAGNIQLCGYPLPKCTGDHEQADSPTSSAHEEKDDKKEKILFWFVVTSGYATGLWAVVGVLVVKKNWRIAYFRFADDAKEWIIVMAAVTAARLKHRIQRISSED